MDVVGWAVVARRRAGPENRRHPAAVRASRAPLRSADSSSAAVAVAHVAYGMRLGFFLSGGAQGQVRRLLQRRSRRQSSPRTPSTVPTTRGESAGWNSRIGKVCRAASRSSEPYAQMRTPR